jgi:hypothetical protein
MRRALVGLVGAAAVAAAFAAPGGAANECRGILVCISVPGPWVIVPARAEATYLLECPRRRGVVGGVDALATSRDVRVGFDARIGSPVSPGTTTGRDAFFRAVSARHRRGAFQPYLGCIPTGGGGGRATTSARVAAVAPGVPFERRATTVKLGGATVKTVVQGCAKGERLVGSWHALAFRTKTAPNLIWTDYVRVKRTIRAGHVVAQIVSSEGIPTVMHAEVQVGAVCAT